MISLYGFHSCLSGLPVTIEAEQFGLKFISFLPALRIVGAVVRNMAAEIAACAAGCDKTRALKQGMMQEQLT
jgi:hypothetical protein